MGCGERLGSGAAAGVPARPLALPLVALATVVAVPLLGAPAAGCVLQATFRYAPWLNGRYYPTLKPELQLSGQQRAVYAKPDGSAMIHHWSDEDSGDANWVVAPADASHAVGNGGWLAISSWSVTPQTARSTSPRAFWTANTDLTKNTWMEDPSVSIICMEQDRTHWLDVGDGFKSQDLPPLSGYYVDAGHYVDRWPALRLVSAVREAGSPFVWLVRRRGAGNQQFNWTLEQGSVPGSPNNQIMLRLHTYTPYLCGSEKLKWSTESDGEVYVDVLCEGKDSDIHSALRPTVKSDGWRKLSNGHSMPLIGLGTGAYHVHEAEEAISGAIAEGYVLLDSASAYNNEEIIGSILRQSRDNRSRRKSFITSKLWYSELGYQESLTGVRKSLSRLGFNYLDLELIHWPQCYEHIEWMDCKEASAGSWSGSWRALERLYAEGFTRSIGVSNFDVNLLNSLLQMARTPPHVLQNHATPSWIPHNELDFCQHHNILFQAYSSLRGFLTSNDEKMKLVKSIGFVEKRSPTEVALRWMLDLGMAIIPRSIHSAHRKLNLELHTYHFSDESRELLDLTKHRQHGDEL